MPNKNATRAARRWLCKETHMWEAWESMSLDTLEDFTRDAKAYLRDKSELRGSTIENADYTELLKDFRITAEWKPRAVEIPGLGIAVTVPQEQAAPAKRSRARVQRTREGIPVGRYAIDVPGWGLRFFWIKLERDKLLQHTAVRFLDDNGKWRMYYGGVREVLELIREAGWAAASRYGEIKKTCALCGQPLRTPGTKLKGVGPECEPQIDENPFGPNS